ncbi:phosphoethanolamine--lipid A transferase [Massilia sp. CCM 8694]|uniref:Phosphoethanolamine--lipid A transferase n=1 Tax=Massilia genomosp. 1 TaxID=2609280 RepID=A0ABX0MKQ7_9BURK|nr:phosphoethanolamine--lipid A transferase [Massilia genomosp. 1]
MAAAVILVGGYNLAFWTRFIHATGGLALPHLPIQAGMFLMLVLAFGACLALVNFRYIFKPVLIALFLATSAASYFMNQYGTAIDWSMVQNVVETDARESADLLSLKMLATMLLMGGLPSLLLAAADLRYPSAGRQLLRNLGIAMAAFAGAIILLMLMFKTLAPTLREHRDLRFLLTPTNYLQAINGYAKRKWSTPIVVSPLGTDASKGPAWNGIARYTVTVMVVGETARARNFSLNGYARQTNPRLAQQEGLINFTRMQSCGTATAVSVPCVFSALGRHGYSDTKARSQEGLLDVLKHAGIDVIWRDNNSGCKGVCDRVQYVDVSKPEPGNPLCQTEECFDERLLEGLPELIRNAKRDLVIVLHQKGSHGPAYWKRYPARFKQFQPTCETNELAKCSREAIVAAYDNTILYTDYVLSKTIGMLAQASLNDNVDTAFLYFSDHGESLGENNMYLHGAPYIISPPEQRHVPFMLWMSDGFSARFKLDRQCLAARANQDFSHDNIFHSTLGMLAINTAVYNPKLDLFNACTRAS